MDNVTLPRELVERLLARTEVSAEVVKATKLREQYTADVVALRTALSQPQQECTYDQGWNDCLAMWAYHLKRMNEALEDNK